MAHEFKAGDRVRVIDRRPDKTDTLHWDPLMDKTLGEEGVIDRLIENPFCFKVRFPEGMSWIYLPEWLLPVEAAAKHDKPQIPFKPGDRVRVKPRGRFEKYPKNSYGDPVVGALTLCSPGMTACCGKEFTVTSVSKGIYVGLRETPFIFSFDMIEPVEAEARPSLSGPLGSIRKSTAGVLGSLFAKPKTQHSDKLPLINTTKLLTNIKLD